LLAKQGREATLLIEQTLAQKKVSNFLDSVERNSKRTSEIYQFGLAQFQTFLNTQNKQYTLETIITKILTKKLDIYSLLDNFVSYLSKKSLSASSIIAYVAAVKSYLQYHDIDIIPNKFKARVRLPKNHNKKEYAIDASDIREILKSCDNTRIKAILYVLASSGIRITECLTIRNRDIDFNSSPTKITIRAENTKTRTERDVDISDEATKFVKEWIDRKYRDRVYNKTPASKDDDIVFSGMSVVKRELNPRSVYGKVLVHFHRILETISLNEKKDGRGKILRNKITIHSFRRFVYTTICNSVDQAFAEDFLGHSGSVYHTMKEAQKREIYTTKIMKHLTFLDFTGLEFTGKSIEAKLEAQERENARLRDSDRDKIDSINQLSDDNLQIRKELKEVKELLKKLMDENKRSF
jgi:integrase